MVIDVDLDSPVETRQRRHSFDSDGAQRHTSVCTGAVREHQSKYEVEQLFNSPGSLPAPLSRDQREAVIRTLMPTATHEMLARVPRELLNKASEDAQALRRKLVHGATVVFVCSGLRGKRFILERAAELGIKSVVLDQPDSWSKELVAEGVIAKFLPVDMSQTSEKVFDQALASIRSLGDDGVTGSVDGITTFVELSVPLVARLCEALGLPGLGPQAVDEARDKYRTRACLAKAGLPTPRNFLIKSQKEIAEAGQKVGFPAVLKPVSGAASLGVKKVEDEASLHRSYKEIVDEMSTLVISSGALIKGEGSTNAVGAESCIDLTLLLEQYLDGPEVDVDVVMSEGEWRYACVSDNGPTLEPYFNETWAACPSLLPKEKQVLLKELSVNSVKALGFSAGVFHVECKFTSTGPQLIECNARMGGGQVRECNLMTWGVDLVEETLFIALGIPSRPQLPKNPIKPVAYCYVNAKKSGTLGSVDALGDLLQKEGVVWAKPLARPGSKVVGPADGLPTWICDLLVTKPTAKEALEFLHKLEDELPVDIV
jgi:carnosine synthase